MCLVVADHLDLALGEDRVDVVAVDLALRHQGVDACALKRAHLGANAPPQAFLTEIRAPTPRDDRYSRRIRLGAEPHLPRPHEGDRPQVTFVEVIGPNRLEACLDDLPLAERHREHANVGRIEQAPNVFFQAKDRASPVFQLVTANALEDAQPVVKCVRQYVDVRLRPRNELPIEPDLVHFVDHCCSSNPHQRGVARM